MKTKITDIINKTLVDGTAIGSNCVVIHNGETIFSNSFGYADKENNIPMQSNTIFRLFSLTKVITSFAAMILIDRGLLSPDDSVSRYIPEFSNLTYADENGNIIPCPIDMKVYHLLNMTSGLPYANNWGISVCASAKLFDEIIERQRKGNDMPTLEFCRKSAQIPLLFIPGEKWDYGISADIMGGIIEIISEMKYSEFLRKNIFEPLGMFDTSFYVPAEKIHRFSALYSWQDNKGLARDYGNYLGLTDYTAPPSFESGGAGLVSTIEDYSKFALMLLNRGEHNGIRLLSERTFEYMTSPKLNENQKKCLWDRLVGYNYGNFMRILEEPEKSVLRTSLGEFGWDGWTGTFFAADPANKLACLYFTQICGAGTTEEARKICSVVYDELIRKI